MREDIILDHEVNAPKKTNIYHKLALIIEVGLWAFMIFSFLSPWMGTESISVNEVLKPPIAGLYSLLGLLIFYLLFPIMIFRSSSWKQHIASHFTGFVIITWLLSIIFNIEAWPYVHEMRLTAFLCSLIFGALSLTSIFKDKTTKSKTFYLNVFIRMAIIALLTVNVLAHFFHQMNH